MLSQRIIFKLSIKGNGIVNYDSVEQKWFLRKFEEFNKEFRTENLKFCKKSFEKNNNCSDDSSDKKSPTGKVKIDSACIRYNIYKDISNIDNPNITHEDESLAKFIFSKVGITRGYLRQTQEKVTYKRASCLCITSAIDVSNQIPYMEVHTNYSVDGTTKKEEGNDKKKTSLYYSESVGEISYKAKGSINLNRLKFMSCSPEYGRMAFKDSWLEGDNPLIEKIFIENYGYIPYESGYYNTNPLCHTNRFPERGILFHDDFVREMVKFLLTQIRTLFIESATAMAYAVDMQAKIVTDGFSVYDDKGWVSINSEEDIINFLAPLEIQNNYVKVEV